MADASARWNVRPRRRDDVAWVVLDGEAVLWDPVERRVHRFDHVATALWQISDGSASIDELVEDLVTVSGLDRGQAIEMLDGFFTELAAKRLVEESHPQHDTP